MCITEVKAEEEEEVVAVAVVDLACSGKLFRELIRYMGGMLVSRKKQEEEEEEEEE